MSADQRWREESRELRSLRALTAGIPGAAYNFVVHESGTPEFRYVSPACAEIYGFSAEMATRDATLMHDAIHPVDRPSFDAASRQSLASLEILQWEGRIVRTDGAVRQVTITSQPVHEDDGDGTLWNGLVVDRTALAEATTDGREGFPEAAGDTLAILGHEIGTPLTAITAAAELGMQVLEEESAASGGRHEDLVRCLWTVQRNTARLELLRDGLLKMVHADSGRLVAVPSPVLLRPRLEAAVSLSMRPSAVSIDCASDLTCWVQPSHLDQMLLNLLINADKYAGGAAAVQASVIDGVVTVMVEDQGPGVPSAFRDQLFSRFSRHESTSALPGTGLGLFIVRELAELNGGGAKFAPAEPVGARFTVTLPHPSSIAHATSD